MSRRGDFNNDFNTDFLRASTDVQLQATEAPDVVSFAVVVGGTSDHVAVHATEAPDVVSFAVDVGKASDHVALHATEGADTAAFSIDSPNRVELHATEAADTAHFVVESDRVTLNLHATEAPDTASFSVHVEHSVVIPPPIFLGGGASQFTKPPKIKVRKKKQPRLLTLHVSEAPDTVHFGVIKFPRAEPLIIPPQRTTDVKVHISEAEDHLEFDVELGFSPIEMDNQFLLIAA